jgi:hypothetical protein
VCVCVCVCVREREREGDEYDEMGGLTELGGVREAAQDANL